MKPFFIGLFCVLASTVYSQQQSTVDLSLSGGFSTPSSSFADDTFTTDGSFFDFSATYYFSTFGIGVSLGTITNPTEKNSSDFSSSLAFPTTQSATDWKTTYYGIGPYVKIPLNKFQLTFNGQAGMMNFNEVNLTENYDNVDIQIPTYTFTTSDKTSSGYFSTGVKLGYRLTENFSIYATSQYLSSLSKNIEITETVRIPQDINKNGIIDAEDFYDRNGELIAAETATKETSASFLNIGAGIVYSFKKQKNKREKTREKDRKDRKKENNKLVQEQKINPTGTIAFTNVSKERKKKKRQIRTQFPKNNSTYDVGDVIEKFTWEVVGEKFVRPHYVLTIQKISATNTAEWVLTAKTSENTISISEIMNQNKSLSHINELLKAKNKAIFNEGKYRWSVQETTIGTTSNTSFFNFNNCEIDFSITNEEIECVGYEGENRKFKICFDATYSSVSGDLTYANALSGLTVYDQAYSPLSYTLVSPNPTLVSQVGSASSTVSYCFEVVVSSSVTAIGFGLQGDDLDPSPIVCQPGVSLMIDELPECICDDCDEIELSFKNFSISANNSLGNQFNFNGNINVNVPIYGISFQVQSYSYSANPSACTNGVSSVEESGMILLPGTTINGSSSLQLANETASGSASSNNNATKLVTYISSSAITGLIPVNLTIGLPGPLAGLDASCCEIEYSVCIKVSIFYEEGNCKSCDFTQCFEFNNQ